MIPNTLIRMPPRSPKRIRLKHKLELIGYRPNEAVAAIAGVTPQFASMWFAGKRNSEIVEQAIGELLREAA